jgi:hypothetical protein
MTRNGGKCPPDSCSSMSDRPLPPLDYATLLRVSRRLDPSKTSQKIRIALLSDAATQQFVPVLRALFHRQGVDAVVYEGAFDAIRLETLDPDSGLYRFHPDAVVLLNSVQALRAALGNWTGEPLDFLREQSESMLAIWDALQISIPAIGLRIPAIGMSWGTNWLELWLPSSFCSGVR